jgi:hypothetical protein
VYRSWRIQAGGQIAPLIQNIHARHTTDLDGRWQAIVDPYDVGALDYRAQCIKGNSAFFKNYKPQSESELVEYDFNMSGQLNVPGDWNTQRDSLLFYEGSVWSDASVYASTVASRRPPQTSRLGGSLLLSCRTLSFPAICRFDPGARTLLAHFAG